MTFGIQTFDSSGKITLDIGYKYMRVIGVVSYSEVYTKAPVTRVFTPPNIPPQENSFLFISDSMDWKFDMSPPMVTKNGNTFTLVFHPWRNSSGIFQTSPATLKYGYYA